MARTNSGRAPGQALSDVSGEMALSSAWCAVLPLWLLWGAACSRAASGDGSAFPFDIEGSSAFGRLDPPETSEPRVAPGSLPPAAKVQCPCRCHPTGAPAPRAACATLVVPLPRLPFSTRLESFTWTRSVQKLEIKSFTLYFRFGLWNMSLFELAKGHVS